MRTYNLWGIAEPFSSLSHLVAAGVCLVYSVRAFHRLTLPRWERISLVVFYLACIFLLATSGLFHLLPFDGYARGVVQVIDRAAIFLLIAGTFTPIHVILFTGFWRRVPLVLIWTFAIASLVLTVIYFTDIPDWVSLLIYLGMGWSGALTGALLWARSGFHSVRMLCWGALFYTCGAVLDFVAQPVLINGVIGPHELFHVAVVAALAFHWRFIEEAARSAGQRAGSGHAPFEELQA